MFSTGKEEERRFSNRIMQAQIIITEDYQYNGVVLIFSIVQSYKEICYGAFISLTL